MIKKVPIVGRWKLLIARIFGKKMVSVDYGRPGEKACVQIVYYYNGVAYVAKTEIMETMVKGRK
jgi:hypothetical protein